MNPAFPHDDGLLLVVDGPDASGKTKLIETLESYMRATGKFIPVVKRFPTKGPIGQIIRGVWDGDPWGCMKHQAEEHQKFAKTMPWLHAADQLTEEEDTTKALMEKRTVIYDRHHLVSSWAYQIDLHTLERLHAVGHAQAFRRPDMVFIMDTPPEEILRRLEERKAAGGKLNPMYEKLDADHIEMLCNRYAAYAIMHRENVVSLNGMEDPEVNAKKVIETITMLRDMYDDMLRKIHQES